MFVCEWSILQEFSDDGAYETILDPYTGRVGYPCRLTNFTKNYINNNPTYVNSVYQTFLQRAMGKIGPIDYLPIT